MIERMHPFTQLPSVHKGWDHKQFTVKNRTWTLLNISDRTGQRCQISADDTDARKPWPHWRTVSFGTPMTVEDAVRVITLVYAAYTEGEVQGSSNVRAEMRQVLGLAR